MDLQNNKQMEFCMQRRYRPQKPAPCWKGPKPLLAMTVAQVCRVHYLDLQAYLSTVYKMRGYKIFFALGITPGMYPEFIVTGKMPPVANIGQQIDDIRRGRLTKNLGLILNVLCADGFIGKGKYIIDTSTRGV